MASLECSSCGGEVVFYIDSGIVKCEFCGRSQTLQSLLAEDLKNSIINDRNVPKATVDKYKRAISLMSAARDEQSFIHAAEAFEDVREFNSDALAVACRERASLIKKERMYQAASKDMLSSDPKTILKARDTFEQITDYKDANVKRVQCDELIKQVEEKAELLRKEKEAQRLKNQQEQEKQEKKEQKKRKRAERKRKLMGCLIRLIIIALIVAGIWGYVTKDSRKSISISFEPADTFLVEDTKGRYSFKYDVELKNNGRKDIESVRGSVVFEYPEGNVIVDTDFDFTSYSGAAVRSGKKSNYTWTLTVYDYDTALILYETDHDDIIVTVNIEYITYTDGKHKYYK